MEMVIAILNKIGKDKYQHFAVGAILALGVFVVMAIVCSLFLCPKATFWVALDLSAIAVTGAALWKEKKHDAYADWKDILFTLGGGLSIWVAAITTNLIL